MVATTITAMSPGSMMPSRIYHIAATLMFIALMATMALMCVRAPAGGIEVAGLQLFAQHGFADGFLAALKVIGFEQPGQKAALAALGALNMAAAGVLVFALMFLGFGHASEQRESLTFYQVAAAIAAAACVLAGVISLAAGSANAMLVLQALLFAGLVQTYSSFNFGSGVELMPDAEIDRLIAGSAASQAAFTAQLLSLSKRGSDL